VEQQLIALYLRVCRAYDSQPTLKYQRLSNFRPRFTDEELLTIYLFADKAYADEETKQALLERGTRLITPDKRRRNEPETNAPALWSRFASSVRQPLESLFGWLIQRTNIQNASLVRSTKGLFVHCYGKLAAACLLLTFNS